MLSYEVHPGLYPNVGWSRLFLIAHRTWHHYCDALLRSHFLLPVFHNFDKFDTLSMAKMRKFTRELLYIFHPRHSETRGTFQSMLMGG